MNKDFYNYRCEIELEPFTTRREFPHADLNMHCTCSPEMAQKIAAIIRNAQPIDCTETYMDTSKKIIELVLSKSFSPKVKRVIFNGPATILFWDDGEKTVVKCRECQDGKCIHDDDTIDPIAKVTRGIACSLTSDPEKAVMAAMLKRLYKNYQDVLREALEVEDE